jgi:hypothetical protein
MLKVITLLLSFLMGRANLSGSGLFSAEGAEEIVDQSIEKVAAKIRVMMGSFALGAAGLTLLLAGTLVAYFHLLDQWDVTDIVVIDAVFAGGVALAVLGLILFGFSLRLPRAVKAARRAKREEFARSSSSRHPLEDAVAAFIYDTIKEREFSRETRRAERRDQSDGDWRGNDFDREQASGKNESSEAQTH